jgi:hypothetical protein
VTVAVQSLMEVFWRYWENYELGVTGASERRFRHQISKSGIRHVADRDRVGYVQTLFSTRELVLCLC